MSKIQETTWAYLAGLIDGEGYFDIFLHSNPSYRREMKRGYARQFSLFIANCSKELLENVKSNIGNIGTITWHKRRPATLKREEAKGHTHKAELYTLRFYANNLRIILPKVIPYLILKKRPAEIMLRELETVKKIHNPQLREITLLQIDKQFDEVCHNTPGSKYRKVRKQSLIREKMSRYGKAKLDLFADSN